MNKNLAVELRARALEIAKMYSNPERGNNFNKETFELLEIIPLSELTALAVFLKQPSGKKSLSFFHWCETAAQAFWKDFFLKESHVLGMQKVAPILADVEKHNFLLNFEPAKLEELV